MLVIYWIIGFVLITLFSWWIVMRGGADKIQETPFSFLFEWFLRDWNEEQIRFYVMCMWVVALVVFILGLFYPSLRHYRMGLGQ